jgi:hypothetical protein
VDSLGNGQQKRIEDLESNTELLSKNFDGDNEAEATLVTYHKDSDKVVDHHSSVLVTIATVHSGQFVAF